MKKWLVSIGANIKLNIVYDILAAVIFDISLKFCKFALMKQAKLYIQQALNLILLYAAFYATQGKFNPSKWDSQIAETFIFYSMAIVIFTWIQRYKT